MDERSRPAPEQAEMQRRSFLKWLVSGLAVINSLILGIPFVGTLLSSTATRGKAAWSRVGVVDKLPVGAPVEVRFQSSGTEAYYHRSDLNSVWVIMRGPGDVTVFSPICTHLGCHFTWNRQHGRFECPCHASVFALDGTVLYGPAPRRLDTLPAKIENNVLYVEYKRFQVGTPEKKVI